MVAGETLEWEPTLVLPHSSRKGPERELEGLGKLVNLSKFPRRAPDLNFA